MSTTLLSWTSGKLQRQPVATAASCQLRGPRIFVTDQVTKRRFLVDYDSDICCFPRTFLRDKRPRTSSELSAVNHLSIKTYGSLPFNSNFKNLCRDFLWNFVIADVTEPIIGPDFLAYYSLLPDCRYDRLFDATTGFFTPGQCATTLQPNVKALTIGNQLPYHDILAEFPDLTRASGRPREVRHSTVHYIRANPGPWSHAAPVG
ncbi:uncharacterized protein LOC119173013 [Rhipicephalus microplus]|uniref:uncharacterized protein LOC119173013 n=1 Tax=Rhipicephalus microplus TaxID=6941 RepID=UPI0018875941|nr:uncharacterized protein LOC119173013 [Rhipicephalus microplus]